MPIRRKPRKSAINDFVSMIVPDRIEEAFDRVDAYFTQHLQLSFDTPEGVAGVLHELMREHGENVRKALYALLCEENSPLRSILDEAKGSGAKSAVGLIVPVLVAQFAFAPAVALLIATLVLKAVAANGEKALCEELVRQNKKTLRYTRAKDARKNSISENSRRDVPLKKTAGKPSGSRKTTSKEKPEPLPPVRKRSETTGSIKQPGTNRKTSQHRTARKSDPPKRES